MTMWRVRRLDVNVVPATISGSIGCNITLADDDSGVKTTLFFQAPAADFLVPATLKLDIKTAFTASYTPNDFA